MLNDQLSLSGSRGNRFFKVLYRNTANGNVTSQVLSGAYEATLAADEKDILEIEVSLKKPAFRKSKRHTTFLKTTSVSDPTKKDAGRAVSESRKKRKR